MREQMKGLDDLEMGDLWSEAQVRTPRPQPEPPTPRSPVRSRVTAGIVAFAVFIAAGVFAWQAFRTGPTTVQAPGDGAAGVALWPERTAADLAQTQALADSGDPTVAWRLDPKEVATHFVEDVLGWGPAVPQTGSARYVVNLETAQGAEGSVLAIVEPLPLTCESSPVPATPGGPAGSPSPSSFPCPRPTETEAILMRQLGTTGDTGVWSITSVNASGLNLDLKPGDVLTSGQEVNGSVTFPSSAGSVDGFGAEAGVRIGTSPGCDQAYSKAIPEGDGALMVVSVDPSTCDDSMPAAYAWIATGTDVLFAHSKVSDPLRFPTTDVLPYFYGLTVTPFALSLAESVPPTASPSVTRSDLSSCGSSDLQLFLDGQQLGTFHYADIYAFKNVSGRPCSIKGYPSVSATDSSGRPIVLHVSRDDSSPAHRVALQPGDSVSFSLTEAINPSAPNAQCGRPAATIDITPPGATAPLSTTDSFVKLCDGDNLYVSLVRAGLPVPSASPQVPRCNIGELQLELGQVSEATGQNSRMLSFTNVASTPCSLFGYPGIKVLDTAGQSLPLVYRQTGDQMVTSRPPATVIVAPGGVAYAMINKYRCDAGDKQVGRTLVVSLPGGTQTLVAPLGRSPDFSYCGQGDPGSIVSISPFEPTASATSAH